MYPALQHNNALVYLGLMRTLDLWPVIFECPEALREQFSYKTLQTMFEINHGLCARVLPHTDRVWGFEGSSKAFGDV